MPRMMQSPSIQWFIRHKLAVLLALVVVMRLLVVLATPGALAWGEAGPTQGVVAYDAAAQQLLASGQFASTVDARLSPVYSIALAGAYGWFGRGAVAVALWHTVLAVLTAYACYAVGGRLFRSWGTPQAEAVGWMAGLFIALSPVLIIQTLTLDDTPLALALLALGLLLLAALRDRRRLNARTVMLGVMGGVVLGLGALLRPALLPLLSFSAVWFLFRLPLPQTLLRIVPVALVGLLIVQLWPAGRGGVPGYDVLSQPLDLMFVGVFALMGLLGVAVSLRLWRDVSLLWFLPLSLLVQQALLPSPAPDVILVFPALFLFAAAALVWLAASMQARRLMQVPNEYD